MCIKGAQFRHSEPNIRTAHPLPPKPTPIVIHPKWPPPSLPLQPAPPPLPTMSSLSMAVNALRQSTGVYLISLTIRRTYGSNVPTFSHHTSPPPTKPPVMKPSVTSKRKAAISKPSTNLSTWSNGSITTSRHIMRDTREKIVGETTGNDSVGPSYGSGHAGPDRCRRHREVFTLGHIFRADSARNPSSPSTPAGIFPTSPSEIEVCSKHLNSAENVLMHSH